MADWARYMFENQDVYSMFSDGGKWSWGNGRQQNAYMRQDGSPLQAETAAQYAANHYKNFGKGEGRKLHEQGSTDYAAKLGGGGGQSGGNSELNAELAEMIKSLAKIAENPNATPEEKAEAAEQSKTILTNFGVTDDKKKKSFLTPMGSN